jgi:hypothetical protein
MKGIVSRENIFLKTCTFADSFHNLLVSNFKEANKKLIILWSTGSEKRLTELEAYTESTD